MKPTIGRIVIYKTTAEQKDNMEQLLKEYNISNIKEELPAIIVAVHNVTCVNLKVFQDGNGSDIWVRSAIQGDQEGQWNWPVIEPQVCKPLVADNYDSRIGNGSNPMLD